MLFIASNSYIDLTNFLDVIVDLLLIIIGGLVLEHPNSDGLDAAFGGSNTASNPATLAALRRVTPVTALNP
jgi:preprotein translocase subunit SecG